MVELKDESEDSIPNDVPRGWRKIVNAKRFGGLAAGSFALQPNFADGWLIE